MPRSDLGLALGLNVVNPMLMVILTGVGALVSFVVLAMCSRKRSAICMAPSVFVSGKRIKKGISVICIGEQAVEDLPMQHIHSFEWLD